MITKDPHTSNFVFVGLSLHGRFLEAELPNHSLYTLKKTKTTDITHGFSKTYCHIIFFIILHDNANLCVFSTISYHITL